MTHSDSLDRISLMLYSTFGLARTNTTSDVTSSLWNRKYLLCEVEMNERWIRAVWFLREAHISSLFVLGLSQTTQMLLYSPFEQFFRASEPTPFLYS